MNVSHLDADMDPQSAMVLLPGLDLSFSGSEKTP